MISVPSDLTACEWEQETVSCCLRQFNVSAPGARPPGDRGHEFGPESPPPSTDVDLFCVFEFFFFCVWWWSVDRVSSRALQIGTDRRVLAGWASACMRLPWTPFSINLCPSVNFAFPQPFLFFFRFFLVSTNRISSRALWNGPLSVTPIRI